jgi:hypothetical protein
MCLKKDMCYNVIVACGALLGLFGLVMIIMGIVVSTNSSMINNFFDLEGLDGSLKNMISASQGLLYVVGIYLLIVGAVACFVKKQKKTCCTLIYGVSLPPVVILMLIIAIPIFMINGVSEDMINQMCAASANSKSASRLLQAAKDDDSITDQLLDDGKKNFGKYKDLTVDKLNIAVKKGYEFMGPTIKSTDDAIATASSAAMCRTACPCAPVTNAKSYSKNMQVDIAAWKANYDAHTKSKNKGNYTGLMFNGEIKNFDECLLKLKATPDAQEAECVKANATADENVKDNTQKAKNVSYNTAQKAKCAAVKAT